MSWEVVEWEAVLKLQPLIFSTPTLHPQRQFWPKGSNSIFVNSETFTVTQWRPSYSQKRTYMYSVFCLHKAEFKKSNTEVYTERMQAKQRTRAFKSSNSLEYNPHLFLNTSKFTSNVCMVNSVSPKEFKDPAYSNWLAHLLISMQSVSQ